MYYWVIRCSEDYFSKLVLRLKAEMLKEKVLHCDETYVKVLKEQEVSESSKQYMWVYRTGKHSSKQIVIYDYNKSRSGDVPKAFLKDYDGYLHTDGYSGYNKLNKVTHCNCWAHLRCKFHEAIIVDSEDSIAKTARDFCDKLFAIESELDKLTTEERFKERLTQEKPVFEAFWSWAEKVAPTVLLKTQLEKAFEYAFKRREYLGNYFKNGDCAISNNAAENAIRPFTVGRKNWLFSDTPNGAKASADIYSIVETAKANRLDVFRYFELILTVLPGMEFLTNPDILIVDEPTRGIDVGAKAEIHSLITKLAGEGKAIIMISSELPEVMGMSDRIVVMHEGIMTAILDRKDFSSELILKYATSEIPYQPAADEQ